MRKSFSFLILILAVLLPLIIDRTFFHHIFISVVINAILAISLGIVIGYLGELSLAHGAFYAIGAYTSALFAVKLHLPFILSFILGVVNAGLMGFVISIPALRLSGHYFVIATIGFQGIVILLIINLVELTRGPMGLPGIPSPEGFSLSWFSVSFDNKISFYYLALFVLVFLLIITRNLIRYRFGQAFIATREDAMLASSLGISTGYYRRLAFTISTAMAGAAGSLYAHYTLFISPDSFNLAESVFIATMVIIGGKGTIVGPLIGAVLLTGLPEIFRFAGKLQFVLYGLMLMIVVIFMPRGIVGIAGRFYKKDMRKPEPNDANTHDIANG